MAWGARRKTGQAVLPHDLANERDLAEEHFRFVRGRRDGGGARKSSVWNITAQTKFARGEPRGQNAFLSKSDGRALRPHFAPEPDPPVCIIGQWLPQNGQLGCLRRSMRYIHIGGVLISTRDPIDGRGRIDSGNFLRSDEKTKNNFTIRTKPVWNSK